MGSRVDSEGCGGVVTLPIHQCPCCAQLIWAQGEPQSLFCPSQVLGSGCVGCQACQRKMGAAQSFRLLMPTPFLPHLPCRCSPSGQEQVQEGRICILPWLSPADPDAILLCSAGCSFVRSWPWPGRVMIAHRFLVPVPAPSQWGIPTGEWG